MRKLEYFITGEKMIQSHRSMYISSRWA